MPRFAGGNATAGPPPLFWFVIAGIFGANAVIALFSAGGLATFLTLCASTALLATWAGFSALRRQ